MRKSKNNGVTFSQTHHSRPLPLKRSLSAALLASALMAGTSFGQTIDASVTINGTEYVQWLMVRNNNIVDGQSGTTPTVSASAGFLLSDGEIRDLDLTGSGYLSKTGAGTVKISSGVNGNSWTGGTYIFAGTLHATKNYSLSKLSDTFISSGATLDITNTYQEVASLGDDPYSGGGGKVILGNLGHLEIGNTGNHNTFSGTFEGGVTSTIEKDGTGTLTLTGSNDNFNGVISVEKGILVLGDGVTGSVDNLSSLAIKTEGEFVLDMADGGILAPKTTVGEGISLDGTFRAIASGTNTIDVRDNSLGGVGDLIQAGTGRTILLGEFEHTGSTIVESGILQVGDQIHGTSLAFSNIDIRQNGTLDLQLSNATLNGNVDNDGVLFINSVNTINFNGAITGSGDVVIDGDQHAIIRFHNVGNDYSGDTYITSGTLKGVNHWSLSANSDHHLAYGAKLDIKNTSQRIGALSGSGTVDMNNAFLDVGGDDTLAFFDGVLDASSKYGFLQKSGTGVWAFDGSAYNVNGYVLEGVLVVGSTADAYAYWGGNMIVSPGGILAGHGYIDGHLTNSGVVLPGALTPGTLSIGEYYAQYGDGVLMTRIDSKSSFDRLSVDGDAFLNGHLIVARGGKTVRPGDKFAVLQTGGLVYGEFNAIDAYETMVGFRTIYQDDAVIVEFYQKSFAGLSGLTPNQKETAKALNRLSAKGKGQKLIDKLNFESINEVKRDIAILAPEDRAILFNIGFATARIQTGNIERRLDDVRNGAYGFCANGLALSNSRGTLNSEGMPIVNDRDGLSLAGWDGATVVEQRRFFAPVMDVSNRWGFFATGTGEWSNIDSTHDIRGAEFTTGGVTVGADYRVCDNVVVGISGNYANTSSDFKNGGNFDINSGRGAAYASVFTNGLYGNALVGGGYNAYKTRYNTIGGTSRGSTGGGEFDAYLGGGYDYRMESGFTVGPVASLQYTYLGLSHYTETGSDAPMTFPSQSQNSLRSTLGLRASYAFGYGETVIRPEVRAQWGHEFLDSTTEIVAGFAAGGGTFTNTGQKIGRDSLLLDAGVVVEFSPNYAVFAYYTGEIGRENYSSNGVNGGFRLSF